MKPECSINTSIQYEREHEGAFQYYVCIEGRKGNWVHQKGQVQKGGRVMKMQVFA